MERFQWYKHTQLQTLVVFPFCKQSELGKQATQFAHASKFLFKNLRTEQTKEQTNRTSQKACSLLFAWVTWSKQVIGSDLIGALRNNKTKIWTMYFFLSWFVWFAWFTLFALFTKKKHTVRLFSPMFTHCIGLVLAAHKG